MKVKDFIGKYATHDFYGEVFVESAPKGSKVMVNVTVTQRGKGWDDATETYRKYKEVKLNPDECPGAKTIVFHKTKTDYYGTKEQVHIKTLKIKS